jgi:Na+-driven multidrug efflux pump
MISLAINAYFMATGKTGVVLISAAVTACSNVFLDYSLIFGNFGFPELGLEGAAIASTVSDGVGMLFLFGTLVFHKEQKKHQLIKSLGIELVPFREVLKVGSPILLQGLVALSVWTVFFAWIEQMGTHELTVSQNIRSIYFLTFVPIWGFAATTKTYVSQYLGQNRFEEIKIIQRRIQLLTMLFIFFFVHGAIFYPSELIQIINPDVAYTQESADILRMIFGSILIYSYINVYFQTINGSGNTRVTFIIELLATFGYLLTSYLLIKVFKVEIYYVWIVEYVYFGIIGLSSIVYLKNAQWQKKKI